MTDERVNLCADGGLSNFVCRAKNYRKKPQAWCQFYCRVSGDSSRCKWLINWRGCSSVEAIEARQLEDAVEKL